MDQVENVTRKENGKSRRRRRRRSNHEDDMVVIVILAEKNGMENPLLWQPERAVDSKGFF
ncbi:hypothetical protein QUF95_13820 [Paenibacillus silvae]|uniref:hypothetical protein n=1 Tax=Paenibacillus silvae TaxID=1325358 RepID=UPI00259FFD05|nr:hypothetical protein [Paenibacillus silvae]MDM5278476.1 hypothetical protein [Paenibacillus silvae]